jgi:hypothetical protein
MFRQIVKSALLRAIFQNFFHTHMLITTGGEVNLVINILMVTRSFIFPLIPVLWLWLRRQHLFHVVHVLGWWQGSSGCTSGPGTKLAKGLAKVRTVIGDCPQNFPLQPEL